MEPSIKQILIRGPNCIGDNILAQGALARLRSQYANAQITYVAPVPVPELADLVGADSVVTLEERDRRFPLGVYRSGRALHSSHFDLGIALPASFSASFFLFAAGARHRVGFDQSGSGIFLTSSIPWKGRAGKKHKSELYNDLADFLMASPAAATPPRKDLKKEKYFVIAPGASIELREWPYYADLCRELKAEFPEYEIVLVGSEAEKRLVPEFSGIELKNKIGQTSLKEVIDLCSKATAVVCNDSGVAHLSATLAGASTVVLFGPGDPDYISPLPAPAMATHGGGRVLRVRAEPAPECSPCESPVCHSAHGYKTCLNLLSASQVIDALRPLTKLV